jgi:endoglucanase
VVYAVTGPWVKGVHSYVVRTTDTTSAVVTSATTTGVVVQ